MSMETMRQMQSYYRDLDAMEDRCYKKRTNVPVAPVVLSEADIKAQGEELYTKVVKKVSSELQGNLQLHQRSVRCKTRPSCVFDYVVKKFESKGWKAKYNNDTIQVTPPDVLTPLLKSLSE